MKKGIALILFGAVIVAIALHSIVTKQTPRPAPQHATVAKSEGKIISGTFDETKFKSDAQWRKILTPTQYHILRERGTEVAFTGELVHEKRKGTFYSAGCNEAVFRSEQKYDSGTGWPSFWAPIKEDALVLREDNSISIEKRVEVLDKCGNHLGHVFDDGPTVLPDGTHATGKRYCINSGALTFVPDEKQ